MRETVRWTVRILYSILFGIAGVMLLILCTKTFVFNTYNPILDIKSFVYTNIIGILLIILRFLLKKEYYGEYIIRNPRRCEFCYKDIDDCNCLSEDEEIYYNSDKESVDEAYNNKK